MSAPSREQMLEFLGAKVLLNRDCPCDRCVNAVTLYEAIRDLIAAQEPQEPCIFASIEGAAACSTHRVELLRNSGWYCPTTGASFPFGAAFGEAAGTRSQPEPPTAW